MSKSQLGALFDLTFMASVASVLGMLSGLVVGLLMYGVDLLADRAFDFYASDFYSVPLTSGMMFGALIGAIFGALLGLKKIK